LVVTLSWSARSVVLPYTADVIPIAFRTVFPETVLQLGLVGLAAAITWLAIWLLRNVPEIAGGNAAREPTAQG
jgi:hypothetical protein